jgi:hypothetical protein
MVDYVEPWHTKHSRRSIHRRCATVWCTRRQSVVALKVMQEEDDNATHIFKKIIITFQQQLDLFFHVNIVTIV